MWFRPCLFVRLSLEDKHIGYNILLDIESLERLGWHTIIQFIFDHRFITNSRVSSAPS